MGQLVMIEIEMFLLFFAFPTISSLTIVKVGCVNLVLHERFKDSVEEKNWNFWEKKSFRLMEKNEKCEFWRRFLKIVKKIVEDTKKSWNDD